MSDLAFNDARSVSDELVESNEFSERMADLPGWESTGDAIQRSWTFKNHYQAIAFVNAVAWISHQQDHHPDLRVGYNNVSVSYSTHSSGGISMKDLICAAKVSQLQLPTSASPGDFA